jgi:hypothetical protein
MADNAPRLSAPGCLVSSKYSQLCVILVYFNSVLAFLVDVENLINGIGNHLDLARGELQAVKNALHLEGPLRGDPGTRLSAAEKHSALDTGYNNLNSLVYSLEDALADVKGAMNLTGNCKTSFTSSDFLLYSGPHSQGANQKNEY